MKKIMTIMLSMCLMGSCFFTCFGCSGGGGKDKLVTDKASIEYGMNTLLKSDKVLDKANGFDSTGSVKGARFLVNGEYVETFTEFNSRQDVKMEFYNANNARLVNVSGGMSFTVPTTSPLNIDYSIAKYRTQITLGDSILTATAEASNPYANTNDPWGIYRKEWLLHFIGNDSYISKNNLERVKPVVYEDKTTRPGFDIYMYSVKIKDAGKIERPYYNIGIIRDASQQIEFGMFVMKGKEDRTEDMKKIVLSYERTPSKGLMKNYYDAGKPEGNPNWSAETKEYYNKLQTQNTVDWGVFSYSMPGTEDSLNKGQFGYDTYLKKSIEMQEGIEEAWDYDYDIYPTYTHLAFGNSKHFFPSEMAETLAGGDGKNGKPVLQFTYQFTTNNNLVKDSLETPMFDILRGKYDEHLTKLAKDMKAYKKPILFRLNNEMNTDWTSYCGMATLLDPDIFNYTWRYLYNIFEKEGVDNAIWIWNPIKDSCPYSSWGEDLCYNPGEDYIQLMGLTAYEMNNDAAKTKSFKEMYTALYKKNSDSFGQYRSIISEFGCGSGGVTGGLGRNAALQATWVKEMFEEMNSTSQDAYVKQMIGAVWFNCNDSDANGIYNRLRFYDPEDKSYGDLSATIEAFKTGFANKKK